MPIIGLTDRTASFPRIGILRKGAPKVSDRQPGKDLNDHFRLESDHADVIETFRALYGEKPNHIRVMVMFAHAAQNFEAWKEHHSAGALKRRCDGQTCVQRLCTDGSYDFTPDTCVCATELSGADKKHLCRPVGRLKVVIPELARLGYLLVPTTSIHDIIELTSNLEAAEALRGDLRGIPFVLSRRPRKVSTPGDGGQRRRMEKWLLSLEPAPDWVRLQITAMERAALPGQAQLALPAANGSSYVDPESGEIFDGDDDPPEETLIEKFAAAAYERENPPLAPGLETIGGPVGQINTWYTQAGDARLQFFIGDTRAIVLSDQAEAWFDLSDGEVVEMRGSWTVHPKVGRYFAVASITRATVPVEQPEAVAA
jgi:hypothetical protein